MPHITPQRRPFVNRAIPIPDEDVLASLSKGDINYVISRIVWRWVLAAGIDYESLSEGISVLQDAANELYRVKLAPYENEKINENGSAYE